MTSPPVKRLTYALVCFTSIFASGGAGAAAKPRCLFISSYHQGYAWSDGVERGLRSVLDGKCEIRQFDMDTKRNKSEEYKRKIALDAKSVVESWQPDVVITADDNAARYVIQPYFKDHEIPFVFSGINWTAKEYGFPYSNVTGIVEVAPVQAMLEQGSTIAGGGNRVVYVGANTLTENKNVKRFQVAAQSLGMSMTNHLVESTDGWLQAIAEAQSGDFIVLGSNSGINDWDHDRVLLELNERASKLTITNHGWMMPYAMFGLTKIPEEHGEWGAEAALAILSGTRPADIPIVSNRKWDVWANEKLLAVADIRLPRSLRHKAKRVE